MECENSNSQHHQTLDKANSSTTSAADADYNRHDSYKQVDDRAWATFTESFRQVQSVLDRNRLLILQVNHNHQSKIHDNIAKNVALIQEINGNVSKVISLYSDLSANFSGIVHQRKSTIVDPNNGVEGDTVQPSTTDQIQ